eukprot:COSAG01_NODE_1816_length_9171_cov_12.651306_7_plen_255_part_00
MLKQLVDREPVLSLKYRPPAFAGGSGLPGLDGEDAQVAGDGGGGGGGGARTDEGDLSLLHGGGVLSHFSGADICSLLAESPAAAYGSLGDSHEAAQLPYRKWKLKGQTLVADAVCCGHKPLGLGELDPSTPLDKLDPHSASSHGASSEGATSYQLLAAVRGQRAPLAPPPPPPDPPLPRVLRSACVGSVGGGGGAHAPKVPTAPHCVSVARWLAPACGARWRPEGGGVTSSACDWLGRAKTPSSRASSRRASPR